MSIRNDLISNFLFIATEIKNDRYIYVEITRMRSNKELNLLLDGKIEQTS